MPARLGKELSSPYMSVWKVFVDFRSFIGSLLEIHGGSKVLNRRVMFRGVPPITSFSVMTLDSFCCYFVDGGRYA